MSDRFFWRMDQGRFLLQQALYCAVDALVWLGAACGVSAQCQYEITAIIEAPDTCGVLGPPNTVATAINDNGVVTGYYACIAGTPRPFVWSQDTGFVAIPLPPGVSDAAPADINNHGDIVGTMNSFAPGGSRGFLFSYGVWMSFTPLDGSSMHTSEAYAINDSDEVMGERDGLGFHWQDGAFTDIPSPAGGIVLAFAINAHGVAAGQLFGPDHAFWWDGKAIHDIGTALSGNRARANSIDNDDVIVGSAALPPEDGKIFGLSRGFRWENGAVTDLGVLSGLTQSAANSVNDLCQTVGFGFDSAGGGRTPFLWQNSDLIDLRTLIDGLPDALVPTVAVAVNTQSRILCTGLLLSSDGPSPTVSVVLNPIQHPLGDVNFDCVIDERDLLMVLDDWGPDGGKQGDIADIVTSATFQPPGDGRVDGADLAVVLGNWTGSRSAPAADRRR